MCSTRKTSKMSTIVTADRFDSSSSQPTTTTTSASTSQSHGGGPDSNSITCDESTPLLNPKANGQTTPDQESDDKRKNFSIFKLPPRSKSILFLCSLSNFFVTASFSILAPFFPIEAEKKGLSTTTIGLIFSVFELVIFLSSPFFGNFMTRIGTKFVLISGMFVGGCCSILFGLLDKSPGGVTFAGTCFACRTLEALSMSAYITSSFAVLSNEFPKHVATVLGITETASGIGMMVGPAIGGVLYELNGYGLPFFVVGSMIIICGIVLAILLPEVDERPTKRQGSVFTLMSSPMALISLLSVILCSVGISFLDPLFAKHLGPFNLSTALIGLVFVVAPTLYAVFSPFWGHLVDNKHLVGALIVPGHLLYGISFFMIGPSPWLPFLPFKLWLMIVAICLFGLSIGCVAVPNIKCLVLGALEVGFEDNLDTYAVVSGLFNSMFSLGGFVGPTLGGFMAGQIGFDYSATVVGVANIVAFLVTFVFFARRHFVNKKRQTSTTTSSNGAKKESGVSDREVCLTVEANVQRQDDLNV